MKADLHVHTTASDGRFSPAEIVNKAAHLGLSVIAITDHDSVNGIQDALDAAESHPQLLVIPGVEIDTETSDGEIHILGYFMDHRHPALLHTLEVLRASRRDRGTKILAKLAELGLPLEWDRVLKFASGGTIGRPHIAQAMLERGYVSTLKEAFTKYIARGGPAYVNREKLTPGEAIVAILEAHGLPFLAHPGDLDDAERLVREFKSAGLVGIEVYYGTYSRQKIARLEKLAKKYNLLASGGSDYHGLDNTIGAALGCQDIPQASLERLISLGSQKGR